MHDICLHSQLRIVYFDLNVVEIDEGKDMILTKPSIQKMHCLRFLINGFVLIL